jgi:zinc transport system ATP-binding protein
MSIISVKNLTIEFGSRLVLQGINFEVSAGEHVAIIGENGSGKSTLIKTLLGIVKPTSGKIELFGQNLEEFRDWFKIGYVPQNLSQQLTQVPITVSEVLDSGFNSHTGLNLQTRKAEVSKLTRTHDLLNRRVQELSGGQLQRVMIARSLINQPQLLILDEPTNGIDSESRGHLHDFLMELGHAQKLTIMHITHDTHHGEDEFGRVLCLEKTTLCQSRTDLEHIHTV